MVFEGMTDIQLVFVITKLRPIFICSTFYTDFRGAFSIFK